MISALKAMPEHSILLELLTYEVETGKLYWKPRGLKWFSDGHRSAETYRSAWNTKWAGKEAFNSANGGYRSGRIFNEKYWAHRIIFKLMTGLEPNFVDHIDGDRANNRWANLRNVDRSTNQRNAFRRADNASGVTGVSWDKDRRRWSVQIVTNDKNHLGRFACFGAAIKARKIADAQYGYSNRHGETR